MTALLRTAALATVAIVVWLSLTAKPPAAPGAPAYADLVVHVVMHAATAFLLYAAWRSTFAVYAAVVLAVYLEIGQLQAPGRTFSLLDLAANGLGVTTGVMLASTLTPRLALYAARIKVRA